MFFFFLPLFIFPHFRVILYRVPPPPPQKKNKKKKQTTTEQSIHDSSASHLIPSHLRYLHSSQLRNFMMFVILIVNHSYVFCLYFCYHVSFFPIFVLSYTGWPRPPPPPPRKKRNNRYSRLMTASAAHAPTHTNIQPATNKSQCQWRAWIVNPC